MVSKTTKPTKSGPPAGQTWLAKREVREALALIEAALKEHGSVVLRNFGKFRVTERAESKRRHPATGGMITIPARKSVHFKPSRTLLQRLR